MDPIVLAEKLANYLIDKARNGGITYSAELRKNQPVTADIKGDILEAFQTSDERFALVALKGTDGEKIFIQTLNDKLRDAKKAEAEAAVKEGRNPTLNSLPDGVHIDLTQLKKDVRRIYRYTPEQISEQHANGGFGEGYNINETKAASGFGLVTDGQIITADETGWKTITSDAVFASKPASWKQYGIENKEQFHLLVNLHPKIEQKATSLEAKVNATAKSIIGTTENLKKFFNDADESLTKLYDDTPQYKAAIRWMNSDASLDVRKKMYQTVIPGMDVKVQETFSRGIKVANDDQNFAGTAETNEEITRNLFRTFGPGGADRIFKLMQNGKGDTPAVDAFISEVKSYPEYKHFQDYFKPETSEERKTELREEASNRMAKLINPFYLYKKDGTTELHVDETAAKQDIQTTTTTQLAALLSMSGKTQEDIIKGAPKVKAILAAAPEEIQKKNIKEDLDTPKKPSRLAIKAGFESGVMNVNNLNRLHISGENVVEGHVFVNDVETQSFIQKQKFELPPVDFNRNLSVRTNFAHLGAEYMIPLKTKFADKLTLGLGGIAGGTNVSPQGGDATIGAYTSAVLYKESGEGDVKLVTDLSGKVSYLHNGFGSYFQNQISAGLAVKFEAPKIDKYLGLRAGFTNFYAVAAGQDYNGKLNVETTNTITTQVIRNDVPDPEIVTVQKRTIAQDFKFPGTKLDADDQLNFSLEAAVKHNDTGIIFKASGGVAFNNLSHPDVANLSPSIRNALTGNVSIKIPTNVFSKKGDEQVVGATLTTETTPVERPIDPNMAKEVNTIAGKLKQNNVYVAEGIVNTPKEEPVKTLEEVQKEADKIRAEEKEKSGKEKRQERRDARKERKKSSGRDLGE